MLLLAAALLTGGRVWAQRTTLMSNDCSSVTSGWTFTNNITSNTIQQGGYWLLEAGSPKDIIISANINVSSYTDLELTFKVATYGSGANNPALVEYSSDGGSTWSATTFTSTIPTSTNYVSSTWSLGTLNTSNLKFKFTNNGTSGRGVRLDDISLTGISASPTITVSTATLTGFTYNHGSGPSTVQSFTVSGSNLTVNISLDAPTNYEISTSSGSGFGSSITLTQSGGTVASTTIYVRLKAGLALGDYNNENITLSSTNASDKTVTLSGSVGLAAPTAADATNVSATGFTANWGAVSGATGYEVSVYRKISSSMTDLIISEYVEGSSNNKYIEIYNGTGSSVDLSNYKLQLYANGASSPTNDVTLSGTLANGAVKVYKNSSASLTLPNGVTADNNAAVNFNGDDAVALYKISTSSYVDIFGVIGNDPGTEWTADGGYTTVDKTLRRKASVSGGVTTNPSGTDASAFTTLATEWDLYNIDDVSDLGSHTFNPTAPGLIGGSPFTVASTSMNVTGLTAATTYYYTVKAKSGSFESASSDEIEVTTGKSVNSVKTGNWSDSDTWSSDAVPEAKDAITIGNGHTITQNADDASCSALTIQAGGKLIVSSGKHLTVSGDITNNAGNVGLLLESDATGTASLIHSNAGVQATAERYLTGGWAAANSGWHLISSPVAAQAISGFTTDGENNGYDFYGWDEPTNTWMNQKDGGFNTWNGDNFVVGRGYMVSYEQNQTLSFNGALNASDVTISGLTKSGNTYSGWHLLGNPYASAIRWNNGGGEMTLNNLNDNAKIWHEGIKSYSDIGKGGIIPSAQGFMVQATDHNAGITIKLAARVHNNQAFYKNGSGNMVLLVAAEASGASAQESKLLLNSAATAGFDAYHDALFLSGYAPQFFSVSDNEQLSTNAMPDFDDKVIPFGFVKNQADQYIIRLQESPAGMMLKLTDKKTGTVTNLSEHNSYAFSAEEGDDVMRFELEMNALGIGESPKTSTVRLYAYNGYVYLSGLAAPTNFVMTDITGRMVMTKHFNNTGQASLNTGKLPKGVYVVTAITGGQVVSAKVVL
ncbi:hypothetical protein MASR2M12_07130 [Bacteroidales bacterium]